MAPSREQTGVLQTDSERAQPHLADRVKSRRGDDLSEVMGWEQGNGCSNQIKVKVQNSSHFIRGPFQ